MSITAVKDFIAPIAAGWDIHLNRWADQPAPDKKYIVIRPVGGAKAELVRRPNYTVTVIGAKGGVFAPPQDVANSIVEAARNYTGDAVDIQCGEPVYMPTNDGRHVFELAISAIT